MDENEPPRTNQRLILRNTLFLMGAQLAGIPLSIAVNALIGRFVDAANFGLLYLVTTMAQLGFVFVDWGQSDLLAGAVARERARAGEWLGGTLAWRTFAALVAYAALAATCLALGYPHEVFVILFLVVIQQFWISINSACLYIVRGFERSDLSALGQFGQQLLQALLVVPTLMLGGRLRGVLVAQAVGALATLLVTFRGVRAVGVGRLRFGRETIRMLVVQGTPFLAFSVVMMLQSNVDAVLLSKLSNATVVGWHAVAKRLIGAVILPASALISALYPTLSRLHAEDPGAFVDVTRKALRGTAILGVPLALCCALYGMVGVRMFGEASFGPAESNLQLLAPWVFLLYFSMPIGSALLASGKQRAWALTQGLCVVVSAVLDPFLIPWTQARYGNGGLGVCAATVISEIIVIAIGIALAPRGLFDRELGAVIGKTALAGAAMAIVAWSTTAVTPFLAAPIALATYFCVLAYLGGIDAGQLDSVRGAIRRRLARA